MIVKMKHLDLLCVAAEKEETLKALRDLGAVHLDLGAAQGNDVLAVKEDIAEAEKAVRLIQKARGKSAPVEQASRLLPVPEIVADVLSTADEIEAKKSEADALSREVAKYEPYGDFDPELAESLMAKGIDIRALAEFPDVLPRKRLSALKADLAACEAEITSLATKLATADDAAILAAFPGLSERLAFTAAKELMSEQGAVATISGWIPAPRVKDLEAAVKQNGWGSLVRGPVAGETPPTLIEPPKLFRPMTALFAGIGIAPGYTESDVSVPFMCYFSLFFAMLVGDGAYGLIFLIGTLLMWKKLPRSWSILLTVFSLCTVGWGLLSNTWFGAGIPWCADWPTVKWLGDVTYHNMMFLCFTIGVSHLMLARLWNGICMLPSTTAIGQFGWAGVLFFMYLVVNNIVGITMPGISPMPSWGMYVLYGSLAAIVLFSVKPSELKEHGAELGMLPLNVMSALGDIISYVRLFAVGLASVKVAENFNNMALGLMNDENAIWVNVLMAVAMVLILVIGHALNLAMAMLSILVHAVRLNTLEFSNHKGISWSGYAYRAFAR